MSVSLPTQITMNPDILFQELEGETVLLNLANEQYFGLDDIGTRMWQLLDEQDNVEAVVSQMLSEYDVDAETLRADLATLINSLVEAGLVTVS